MNGLFGQQNPRVADMFANMSAGQRFGQAVGNARRADEARMAQSEAMKRQMGMDDLTRRYKEAQIGQLNRGTPMTGAQGLWNQRTRNLSPEDKILADRQALYLDPKPVSRQVVEIGGAEYGFNPNTNRYDIPVVEGKKMDIPAVAQSEADIAQARAAAGERGKIEVLGTPEEIARKKAVVAAELELPSVETKAASMIKALTTLRNHPGKSAVVGVPNWMEGGFGEMGNLPGTDAAGFAAILDQVKGGVFTEAYQELKGGGQITEVEGKKAEQAKTTMTTPGISEVDFDAALEDFIEVITNGVRKARIAAGGSGDVSDLEALTATDNTAKLKSKYGLE